MAAGKFRMVLRIAIDSLQLPHEPIPSQKTQDVLTGVLDDLDREGIGEYLEAGGTTKHMEISYLITDQEKTEAVVRQSVLRHAGEAEFQTSFVAVDSDEPSGDSVLGNDDAAQ